MREASTTSSNFYVVVNTNVFEPLASDGRSARQVARRLLRHGWVDLAILADSRRPMNRERWLDVMLDRLGLVVPRLALSGSDVEAEAVRSLAALQMGLDLLDLKSHALSFDVPLSKSIALSLSKAFQQFATGTNELDIMEAQILLTAIDTELRKHCTRESAIHRTRLTSLVGLRRALFPDAQAPALDGVT